MACGAFHDTNENQAGLDIARHLAIQKIQNDFACRRGLPIPRADGRSRHNYDDGQACFGGLESFLFGHPLGALVMADHLFESSVRKFDSKRWSAITSAPSGWPNRKLSRDRKSTRLNSSHV